MENEQFDEKPYSWWAWCWGVVLEILCFPLVILLLVATSAISMVFAIVSFPVMVIVGAARLAGLLGYSLLRWLRHESQLEALSGGKKTSSSKDTREPEVREEIHKSERPPQHSQQTASVPDRETNMAGRRTVVPSRVQGAHRIQHGFPFQPTLSNASTSAPPLAERAAHAAREPKRPMSINRLLAVFVASPVVVWLVCLLPYPLLSSELIAGWPRWLWLPVGTIGYLFNLIWGLASVCVLLVALAAPLVASCTFVDDHGVREGDDEMRQFGRIAAIGGGVVIVLLNILLLVLLDR